MTDCPNGDIRDLLPDLLHGRLGAAERAEVEAHVRACTDCRDELELLRALRSAMRRAPAVDVGAIVAGIPSYRVPVRPVAPRRWGGWRIAAAVTLLAAGGTSVVVARHGDRTPAAVATAPVTAPASASNALPGAAEVTATPAPRELALAGGTISDLDDSELSTLLDDIGTLNAVTPADVDNAAVAGPLAPNSSGGTND